MENSEIKLQGIDADGTEKTFSLADFAGQKVVLYFYPKDNTSGCTQEACAFRDNYNRLLSKAVVIGVSPDSIKSHTGFQQKQNLSMAVSIWELSAQPLFWMKRGILPKNGAKSKLPDMLTRY